MLTSTHRMALYWLALAAPVTIALYALILLIRAQPYDDADLRDLLMPPDCQMPCFLGIRPGVTSVEEAVNLLQRHQWVSSVVQQYGEVRWFWNGRQPTFLSGTGAPSLSSLPVNGVRVVDTLHIPTRLPAGLVDVLMGKPAAYQFVPSNRSQAVTSAHDIAMTVSFNTFTISAPVACPARLDAFWTEPVELSLSGNLSLYKYWSGWDRQNLHQMLYRGWGCRP